MRRSCDPDSGACVPRNRRVGSTQCGLSQRCKTCIPVGIGPLHTSNATRWALLHRFVLSSHRTAILPFGKPFGKMAPNQSNVPWLRAVRWTSIPSSSGCGVTWLPPCRGIGSIRPGSSPSSSRGAGRRCGAAGDAVAAVARDRPLIFLDGTQTGHRNRKCLDKRTC